MKIGDRVRVLEDDWEGVVIGKSPNKLDGSITVKCDCGAEYIMIDTRVEVIDNENNRR